MSDAHEKEGDSTSLCLAAWRAAAVVSEMLVTADMIQCSK